MTSRSPVYKSPPHTHIILSCTHTVHVLYVQYTHTYCIYIHTQKYIYIAHTRNINSLTHTHTSEKQLTSTLEELKEAQEMISELRQPPPDVPGADRQELLRLLDRRQEYIQNSLVYYCHYISLLVLSQLHHCIAVH